MKYTKRFWVLALIVLVVAALLTCLGRPAARVIQGSTITGVSISGAFRLTDTGGRTVTEKSWPGKYKLVFFGFTHCPGVCPATLQKLSAVMESEDPAGKKLVPVFITVDPERDTVKVVKAYMSSYNKHIAGLTGTPAQIRKAEESFKVFASKMPEIRPGEYMMDHSSYVYLMSPDNRLLDVLGVDETVEGIINKIRLHSR